MTAPSPGIIASTMLNAYYDSHEAYLDALAREMRHEYQAIHEAGLLLQIDAPDLAMERTMISQDLSDAEFAEAMREAGRRDQQGHRGHSARARAAACLLRQLGRPAHPRHRARTDPAGALQAKVGALSIEFANPRHAHEYAALKQHPLPEGHDADPGRDRIDQRISSSIRKWWRGGSRRRWPRSATASA